MTAPTAPQPTPVSALKKRPAWQHPLLVGVVCLALGFAAGAASRGGNGSSADAGATVTATVTATPADPLAPPDGASSSGPVEGEPEANGGDAGGGAFQLDQPYTLEDGSTLTISSPVKQRHSYAGTEYYRFTVSYTNNSAEDFQPMSLTVQATTGTQTAETVIDSGNNCDLMSTDVLPGKTLEWATCFAVPDPSQPFNLQWSVFLTSDKGNVDVQLPA